MNILVHGTILGYGGIAHHTREFTKSLSKYHNVKIRNFNLVDLDDWAGYTGPHVLKNAKHLDEVHHKLLYQQTLYNDKGELTSFPLSGYEESFVPDIHIIMAEVNHYYHYEIYDKPIIIYFPWETTNVLPKFMERLHSVDYLWVPSEWQKQMLITNGIEPNKISVVHEGIDSKKYYPIRGNNDKLTFLHIGTWGYRKSSYEIIKTFLDLFGNNNSVELRISINNKLDYQDSPIETFEKFGLPLNKNVKILGTLSEDEYVKEIQNSNLYISCSRGEGWNLPVIQSMSCGVPSIYSKCGGQLEFSKNKLGIDIDIICEHPAKRILTINKNSYHWESLPDYLPNNLFEPDYSQLSHELKLFYDSYIKNKNLDYIKKSLEDSKFVHQYFNWDYITEKANKILENYKIIPMSNIYYKINSNSFGDTLASTPTLRYLSRSHGARINVVTHNQSIFKNNPFINKCLSFDEYHPNPDHVVYSSFTFPGQKDNNGIEKKFSHIDTRQLHSMDLGFQLSPDDMECNFYPDPLNLDLDLPEKYIILHVTTNWANRTWSYNNWVNLIKWLKDNKIFTVLIGSGYREELHHSYSDKPLDKECPMFDDYYGLDLTNKGTMSDMWWIINGSQCLITMDSGPLHLAGTTDVEIIQLGSAINPKFRAPYRKGNQDYKYHYLGGSCNLFCNSNLFYNVKEWGDINSVPPQPHCAENKPTFECHPSVNMVTNKIKEILKINSEIQNPTSIDSSDPIISNNDLNFLKFGIYTSFYDSEKFIEQSFSVIENINYNNFEWHITDDFSSDDTKKLLLGRINKSPIRHKIKFMEQSEKKQMYWEPNLFFDDTFDWIVLIDSDDMVDPDCLMVYNGVLKNKNDVSLVSSDFHKINENNNDLHSISYILNDDKISNKIDRYHPICDYLNNISYSCFGHLRAFKHKSIDKFEIENRLACAEDSYHVFWSNSYGKYLHIPRPLYKWYLRKDSESHNLNAKSGFNDNFKIALDKLKSSDFGIDTLFNDVYIESCSLGSYDIGGLKNKKVSLWTRSLSNNQKEKLKLLYPDSNLFFNDENSGVNIICLNFFTSEELDYLLGRINKDKILMYYQNQKPHVDNNQKDTELSKQLEYYKKVVEKNMSYSWWTYIRHFIIK
jgi:ADP-heptose:LPS heptosyltransferase